MMGDAEIAAILTFNRSSRPDRICEFQAERTEEVSMGSRHETDLFGMARAR